MRSLWVLVIAANGCMSAQASPHICWFDHPSRTSAGIALHFSPTANASLRVTSSPSSSKDTVEYWLVAGVVHQTPVSGYVPGPAIDDLVVQLGTEASVIGGVHDTCSLKVIERGGIPGVLLEAVGGVTPSGLPMTATDFVPVE